MDEDDQRMWKVQTTDSAHPIANLAVSFPDDAAKKPGTYTYGFWVGTGYVLAHADSVWFIPQGEFIAFF